MRDSSKMDNFTDLESFPGAKQISMKDSLLGER